MFKWAKRKSNETVNLGKKIVGTEQINASFTEVKDMAQTILSPKKKKENAKTETFLEASARLNVSNETLLKNYKNYAYCFYISLLFSLGCFLGMLYNLFINQAIMSSLAMFSILLLCLANCFKFSFRAFQLKHQKLCTVQEWWDRASEWFPPIPKGI